MIGIYKITNPENKIYIGQSKNIDSRIYQHKIRSSSKQLRESIEKYGFDNHKIEIIEECEPNLLLEREKHFINLYRNNFSVFNDYAGRPKTEETVTIRVPTHLKSTILHYINKRKLKKLEKL